MCDRNSKRVYKPEKELSFDEGCCPYKVRLKFKVYNPMKPNRFHIKLFQVCEAISRYILEFSVYTGKNGRNIVDNCTVLDPDCRKTTKVVIGLMDYVNLLDKGYWVYMDNYYTSPELFEELYNRDTFACGTVRCSRKGMPLGVTQKVKKTKKENRLVKGEVVFHQNGLLLAIK